MATGGNGIDGTEYRTTEVRLRRPLPESKLASPDADPHVLKVKQPTGSVGSSSHSRECSIEGGEIVIEYSSEIRTQTTPKTFLGSKNEPTNFTAVRVEASPSGPQTSELISAPRAVEEPRTTMEEGAHETGGLRNSDVMLLQTPEQQQTYHRLLIVKDRGVVTVGEPAVTHSGVLSSGDSRTNSPAPSFASAAMSYSVISVTDDDASEYRELNNATLRRYYGDVTPYGTVAKVKKEREDQPDGNEPPTTNAGFTYETTTRTVSPLRTTSPLGTNRSGTGTLIRRERGGFYTRLKEAESAMGNIGYIDFLPRRLKKKQSLSISRNFEKFQNLVDEANKFLGQNPEVSVKSCESLIQRLDHNHHINSESTTSHDRSYVIGLRLWYTIEEGTEISVYNRGSPVTSPVEKEATTSTEGVSNGHPTSVEEMKVVRPKLCYFNFIPEYKNKDRPKDKPRKHHDCPQFDNMKITMEKLNQQLLKQPINGQLVNIECVPINYSHAFHDRGEIDPDLGYWCLDFQGHWNLFVLRVFYLEGQKSEDFEIDYEDFAPAPTKITPSCPEFQGFQALSVNASRWLSKDSNYHLTVVGSQAIELPFKLKTLVAQKGKIDTHRTCYEPTKISAYWNTLRILRVWYIRPRGTHTKAGTSKTQVRANASTLSRRGIGTGPGIAVRTFTPCQVTTKGCCGIRKPMFATTHDTVMRINEWIALTSADVIAIQTDNVEKWTGKRCELGRPLEDRTYNKQDFPTSVTASSLDYRLTLFRVFIRCDSRGGYPEPDEKEFPPCPPPVEPCCCFVGCSVM